MAGAEARVIILVVMLGAAAAVLAHALRNDHAYHERWRDLAAGRRPGVGPKLLRRMLSAIR